MAPGRTRVTEDSRSEALTAAAGKQQPSQSNNGSNSKGKRGGGATHNNVAKAGSNLKDVVSATSNAATTSVSDAAQSGINWSSVSSSTLSTYRHAHRLDVPSSYASLQNQVLLNHPRGLGMHAPSMIGRSRSGAINKGRRVSKEHLAMAVRKDFNAAAVNETEVVTSFLYAVKNQNKKFRMRFTPGRK